jgi:hypothetical protein
MSLYLLIKKSLKIDAGFIIDKIYDRQIFRNKIFAYSSLLQTMIYKFTLKEKFFQLFSNYFLSFCLITDREIAYHIVNIVNYLLFLHRKTN